MEVKISYGPLREKMIARGLKGKDLQDELNFSHGVLTKIHKNEFISLRVLVRIAAYFDCSLDGVAVIVCQENK